MRSTPTKFGQNRMIGGRDIAIKPKSNMAAASLSRAIEPVGGYTTESVTHGQCDARLTVTFPAIEHHRLLAGTNLYCLVNRAHVCEQLAQDRS